ncbi:MAG: DNA topoisomerase IB [Agriterribacter sp.]
MEEAVVALSVKKIEAIGTNPEKGAAAINLVYVSDTQPGISRIKKGKQFYYVKGKETLKDKEVLQRIKSLVLPPAWENVWICSLDNGHLQATGVDAMQRKQYKYHTSWVSLRNQTKFYRLLHFGKKLPSIREKLNKDLSLPGLPLRKVLAAVVSLMESTSIRVGNNFYEKLYGSFGLTTLKDKHVAIGGSEIKFSFVGKKGIKHDISLKNKKLAAIVKQCRDIPGKDLFQYYEGNEHKTIDSGMVNEYIKELSESDFTAKDFRTWTGTVHALVAFKELGKATTKTELKKKVVEALDYVANHLGNTRTVCKKYYVHPALIELYENNAMNKYVAALTKAQNNHTTTGLSAEEKVVLKILESAKK